MTAILPYPTLTPALGMIMRFCGGHSNKQITERLVLVGGDGDQKPPIRAQVASRHNGISPTRSNHGQPWAFLVDLKLWGERRQDKLGWSGGVETELLAQNFHALQSDDRRIGYKSHGRAGSVMCDADYVRFSINKAL
jgi:hypothetical protein